MAPTGPNKRERNEVALTDDLTDAWNGESERTETPPKGLFQKMREVLPAASGKAKAETIEQKQASQDLEPDAAPPNDLRSYLRRKAALQSETRAKPMRRKEPALPKVIGTVGPVLKSIDSVLGQVRSRSAGDAPRAVLVVGTSTELDATDEAIRIARALARRERAILVDLTRGPSAVSGQLGLPRAPGFTDLAAGRAGFEDVLQAEESTSLQVIPAGNPHVRSDAEEEDATRIIAALSQVYDRLVLHADRETLRKLEPALEGRLQLIVAVIATGGPAEHQETALGELTAFGCQVVPYEQSPGEERPRRLGFFGRAAAV